jgi:hypothetical protein
MSQLSGPDTQKALSEDTLAAVSSNYEVSSVQRSSQLCQQFLPGSFRSQAGRTQLILSPWNPRLPKLFQNEKNFSSTTSIGVLEATEDFVRWCPNASFAAIRDRIQPIFAGSQPERLQPHTLLALIVYIDNHPAADYKCQLSLSRLDLEELVDQIQMHDSAVGDLLGESRYCSAFGRTKDVDDQREAGFEFFCQHPCWLAESCHDRTSFHLPWSVYMHHDRTRNSTTYVIAAARHDDMISEMLGRLGICRQEMAQSTTALQAAAHPFLLHVLVSGIAFQRSSAYVMAVRQKMTGDIAAVNEYSSEDDRLSRDGFLVENLRERHSRRKLTIITKSLHKVSQNCDIGIANADMSIKLCEDMLSAYERFRVKGPVEPYDSWRQVSDSMQWISKTWYRQKEWLISYKARKDTAMNLVCLAVHLWPMTQLKKVLTDMPPSNAGIQPGCSARQRREH